MSEPRSDTPTRLTPGEPGLAGVRVTVVYLGADGVFGTADDETYTTVTDSRPTESGTAPWPRKAVETGVDLGYTGTGWAGDQVWFDRNKDGVKNAGEAGISGATVTVVWGGQDGSETRAPSTRSSP